MDFQVPAARAGSDRMLKRLCSGVALVGMLAVLTLVVGNSTAGAGMGQPTPFEIGMQDPVTPVGEAIHSFHDRVNVIIFAIASFVLILLVYVIYAFHEKRNPTPSKSTHNTLLEIAWTVVPIFILIIIAIPSFKLLFFQYSFPKPDLTIKVTGNTWFWEYEYPDYKGVRVTSNMLNDEDLLQAELGKQEFEKRYGSLEGIPRLTRLQNDAAPLWVKEKLLRQLSVDNEIAVPVNKIVHMLMTSNDVIHSWTVPSFGSKMQAVPGRVTATWFQATRTGVYYGQCSVLCGKGHSGMPIALSVVSDQAFNDWLAAVQARDWKKARGILLAATDGEKMRQLADLPASAD
jgi:cytochrome c oxidase subunit II